MGLAKYFSKDLLAINRLINTNQTLLEDKLNKTVITVAFDENAAYTFEGNCGLDLLVRLLSRLYPRLKIVDLSNVKKTKKNELIKLAKAINSKIELVSDDIVEDVYVVAGYTNQTIHANGKVLYFGSENWVSKFSLTNILSFSESKNPFGCGMSACIVASNIFRLIFSEIFKKDSIDKDFELSVYSLDFDTAKNNPVLEKVHFEDVTIAGIGAIGNGVIWALSKMENLEGDINLVDAEKVSLSNLQRYALFTEDDISKIKVEAAKEFLKQNKLDVNIIHGKWADYVGVRKNWKINCVAVGIDNEIDRIGIQSSLPKIIFNSFTEPESIGISRHYDFTNDACLACSYIPIHKKKDFINEVADNCNISDKAELVKKYYNLNLTVEQRIPNSNHESLLLTIANANNIPVENMAHFNGMKINQFYSDFVCGGVILELSKVENKIENVDAPLAFQSAMAGILLASELVKYFIGNDLKQESRTDFYHLTPVLKGINPYNRSLEKDKTNRCICRDKDFTDIYNKKWD